MELKTRKFSPNFFLSFQEKLVYNGESDCYCEEFEDITDKFVIYLSLNQLELDVQISSLEVCWPLQDETDQMVPHKVWTGWGPLLETFISDSPPWSPSTPSSWTAVTWSGYCSQLNLNSSSKIPATQVWDFSARSGQWLRSLSIRNSQSHALITRPGLFTGQSFILRRRTDVESFLRTNWPRSAAVWLWVLNVDWGQN